MGMNQIQPISAFHDNYIWMIVHPENSSAVVVDPGDAHAVFDALEADKLTLAAILITHHHRDHIGGVNDLLQQFNVPVYGPANEETPATILLSDRDKVTLAPVDANFSVLDTPGHTAGHISYVGLGGVFCGDTLFAGGCGRLFEGTAEQLYQSLQRLAALPEQTHVYCAHEYTLKNLAFAKLVEPDNAEIAQRIEQVSFMRQDHRPSLPSTLAQELRTNPFLRCHFPSVKSAAEKHAGKSLDSDVDVFAALREWKDGF